MHVWVSFSYILKVWEWSVCHRVIEYYNSYYSLQFSFIMDFLMAWLYCFFPILRGFHINLMFFLYFKFICFVILWNAYTRFFKCGVLYISQQKLLYNVPSYNIIPPSFFLLNFHQRLLDKLLFSSTRCWFVRCLARSKIYLQHPHLLLWINGCSHFASPLMPFVSSRSNCD